LVAEVFARYTRNALSELLKSAGIAFGNFNTVEDFAHHPHLRRTTVETPAGTVKLPAAPAVFEEERPPGRVPALDEHTARVRAEFAQ
jgi:itaconate CoA-transferase